MTRLQKCTESPKGRTLAQPMSFSSPLCVLVKTPACLKTSRVKYDFVLTHYCSWRVQMARFTTESRKCIPNKFSLGSVLSNRLTFCGRWHITTDVWFYQSHSLFTYSTHAQLVPKLLHTHLRKHQWVPLVQKHNTGISSLWAQLEKGQREQWANCVPVGALQGNYVPAIHEGGKNH